VVPYKPQHLPREAHTISLNTLRHDSRIYALLWLGLHTECRGLPSSLGLNSAPKSCTASLISPLFIFWRVLWPRNTAWILVAAFSVSGSFRSISETQGQVPFTSTNVTSSCPVGHVSGCYSLGVYCSQTLDIVGRSYGKVWTKETWKWLKPRIQQHLQESSSRWTKSRITGIPVYIKQTTNSVVWVRE
jgi:hypothetical protein